MFFSKLDSVQNAINLISDHQKLTDIEEISIHDAHKRVLAEDIIAAVAPIRQRIVEIAGDEEYLRRVTRQGAERARESAAKTVAEVRQIMGIKSF